MTRTKIEAERDRLAVQELGDHCWPFERGFDAAVALMLKREQVLREALNYVQFIHIDKMTKAVAGSDVLEWCFKHNVTHAKQTLEQIPPWEGE